MKSVARIETQIAQAAAKRIKCKEALQKAYDECNALYKEGADRGIPVAQIARLAKIDAQHVRNTISGKNTYASRAKKPAKKRPRSGKVGVGG